MDQICDLMEKLKLLWSAKIQQGVEVLSGFVLVALFVEPEQDGGGYAEPLGKAHDDVQARLLLVPFDRAPEVCRHLAPATRFFNGKTFYVTKAP